MLSDRPVVVGAGIAGMAAALSMERPCVLVAPAGLSGGAASMLAQGGLAAAVGGDDAIGLHVEDTIAAGDGLCDPDAVRAIIGEGPDVVDALTRAGCVFDRDASGALDLHLEAAHRRARIVHADGDGSGAAITGALAARVRAAGHIEVVRGPGLADIHLRDGRVAAVALGRGDASRMIATRACVVATGGVGGLFRPTTTPTGIAGAAPGSGLAAAMRAGARLADMEFVQFHPTALLGAGGVGDVGFGGRWSLVSEAVRGAGAVLVDERGERFTPELEPRDIVARAIARHIAHGHAVFLDARGQVSGGFAAMFPGIAQACRRAGIDPDTDPIPVAPAVHYHMGGIATDLHGRSDVPGLWAVGEAGCTGLHGANRLASNSLLEAFVMGRRAGRALRGVSLGNGAVAGFDAPVSARVAGGRDDMSGDTPGDDMARTAIDGALGIVRDGAVLSRAVGVLEPLTARCDAGLIGLAMARAALARCESRGSHYRSDYPQPLPTAGRDMGTPGWS